MMMGFCAGSDYVPAVVWVLFGVLGTLVVGMFVAVGFDRELEAMRVAPCHVCGTRPIEKGLP